MTAADDNDKDKGSGAATLLAQLQSQARPGRGYDKALFRVVEVVRGPDGRLSRHGKIWHSDLGQVRRFGRALAANSVSPQVVIADAAGGVIEEIPVSGPGGVGWDAWRASVPSLPAMLPAPRVPKPAAAPAPVAERAAAAPTAEPGWVTDALFDVEAAPDLGLDAGAAAAEPAPALQADAAAAPDLALPAEPALGLLPDPTLTEEAGIVLP